MRAVVSCLLWLWRRLLKSEKTLIRVIADFLWRLQIFNTKLASRSKAVEFEICGCLLGRERLIKHTAEVHCGSSSLESAPNMGLILIDVLWVSHKILRLRSPMLNCRTATLKSNEGPVRTCASNFSFENPLSFSSLHFCLVYNLPGNNAAVCVLVFVLCVTDQSDGVLRPQHSEHGLKMFLEVT